MDSYLMAASTFMTGVMLLCGVLFLIYAQWAWNKDRALYILLCVPIAFMLLGIGVAAHAATDDLYHHSDTYHKEQEQLMAQKIADLTNAQKSTHISDDCSITSASQDVTYTCEGATK